MALIIQQESLAAMKLDIIAIEEPKSQVLKQEGEAVSFPLSQSDKMLIEAMERKLYELDGVGLAAPQVGYSRQIIAIYIPATAALLRDDAKPHPMLVLINPSHTPVKGSETHEDFEACYSVKSKMGKVERYHAIDLRYQDVDGKWHKRREQGFTARVLQHEIDHLNGLLITDRLRPDSLQGSMEEMMKIRIKELGPEQREKLQELLKKKALIKDE